jgi:acyl-CoA synthetase (AMP-forming)/AMP-acid ligase II
LTERAQAAEAAEKRAQSQGGMMSISTLADIVRHQAAAQPARIALTFEERNTSYAWPTAPIK